MTATIAALLLAVAAAAPAPFAAGHAAPASPSRARVPPPACVASHVGPRIELRAAPAHARASR